MRVAESSVHYHSSFLIFCVVAGLKPAAHLGIPGRDNHRKICIRDSFHAGLSSGH